MKRLGLFAAGVAVSVLAGCASAPPVPQWKDPEPSVAVTGAAAAPLGGPGAEASNGPAAAAEPGLVTPSETGPTSEPSTNATAAAVAGAAEGARFVESVRGELPNVAVDRRPEEITEMGGQACTGLAAGDTRATVADDLSEWGMDAADARKLISLADSMLCQR